jgi:quinol-cytochrome oxidoreductase complex cytochrome b subunit
VVDWGPDPGRTRRLWIVTLGIVAIVGMALTVVLAINDAAGADPTILAPIVGTAVGALATIAAMTHHGRDRDDDG